MAPLGLPGDQSHTNLTTGADDTLRERPSQRRPGFPMSDRGFLAIFSDVAPDVETDYLHWLTREHTHERVETAGFAGARVFRGLDVDARRYLILYDLASPAALAGEDYLRKLDAPSAWSRRIMPQLKRFIRGGGRVVASAGAGQGAVVAVVECPAADEAPDAEALRKLVAIDRVVAAHVLATDDAKTSIRTREKAMRTGDATFAALLIVEATDREALEAALGTPAARAALYQQVYALPPTATR